MSKLLCALLASATYLLVGQLAVAQNAHGPRATTVVIDEADWVVLADEPAKHLANAKENVLKKDLYAASTDLRKAAVFLKGAASVAAADVKRPLAASARELESLAVELAAGTESAVARVDGVISRAAHALSTHHAKKAKDSIARKAYQGAGHYLKATADELEQGAKWTGHELEAGTKATLRGTRTLGRKLVAGSGYAVDETGKAIGFVGSEVEKLGKWMKPSDPAPTKK